MVAVEDSLEVWIWPNKKINLLWGFQELTIKLRLVYYLKALTIANNLLTTRLITDSWRCTNKTRFQPFCLWKFSFNGSFRLL